MSAVDFEYCKDEVIAFGEWLLKSGYFISMTGKWGRLSPNINIQDYEYFTTEELYNEFLKS